MNHHLVNRFVSLATVCMLSTIVAGCGSDRPTTVDISGRVLFNGQPPPKPGMVYFTPIEPAEGYPRRPGRASFEADGRFTATTFDDGDGLIPGRYRVAVDCWDKPPRAEGPPSNSLVPPPYNQSGTSPLELTVEPGVPQTDVEFNLQ